MMEFEYVKVEPRMVYLNCPDCGCRLKHQQGGFLTSPPRAWYICENEHRHMYRDGYPRIEYVEVKE
jgi:hypothetical protein